MASSRSGELTLPGTSSSVPEARRFVRSTLQSWELDLLVDAAALIVSELATNAVLHARSPFTVRLGVAPGGLLRVEVADGSARSVEQRNHSQASTTGRGLGIVDELATAWGVEQLPDGKVVWAQLDPAETVSDLEEAAPWSGAVGAGRRSEPALGDETAGLVAA